MAFVANYKNFIDESLGAFGMKIKGFNDFFVKTKLSSEQKRRLKKIEDENENKHN